MFKKESGITLVALIITIIILVILAAVSVSALNKSNMINYAKDGTNQYEAEQAREQGMINNAEDIMREALSTPTATPTTAPTAE